MKHLVLAASGAVILV